MHYYMASMQKPSIMMHAGKCDIQFYHTSHDSSYTNEIKQTNVN